MDSLTSEGTHSAQADLRDTRDRASGLPIAPVLVFVVLAFLVMLGFDRGWLPHDDGYLAMSAERVLEGETPHRDFDEIYTGGLTYLNAWALDAFGVNLVSLRMPYLVALAGFVFSVYAICTRFFTRLNSALIASSVVFLGPYMTSSPMPSSYNVFLAGIVLWCLLKYYETRSPSWVFVAGVITGLGVLAKTTGLYLALGAGIGLIGFHARQRASGPTLTERLLIVAAGLLVTGFVSTQFTLSRFVGLVVPVWLVILLVMRTRSPDSNLQDDLKNSSRQSLIPYSAGILVPLLLFGAVMASTGGLDEMLVALVSIPRLFVSTLLNDLSSLVTLIIPLGIGVLLWRTGNDVASVSNWPLMVSIALISTVWYLVDPRSELSALILTFSWLPVLLTLAAHFIWDQTGRLAAMEPIVLTTIACAVCMQLVRFPTSNQWYIFYSLPLTVIGLMLLADGRQWPRRQLAVVSLVIVAAVIGVAQHQGRIFASGSFGARVPFIELEGTRGGIEVPAFYDYYNMLADEPAVHEKTLLAGPDTPEIYFLLDAPPPGRSAFPLIAGAYGDSESMLDLWSRIGPDTVILNNIPANSELEPGFHSLLVGSCGRHQAYGPLELFAECG